MQSTTLKYDMNMAGMRFFSVYQGFQWNEKHKGEFANSVAQFTEKIANGERSELFDDGSQTRDFTQVDDTVRALTLAASERLYGIFNVGTGESYPFNSMVEMINTELGTDIEPKYIENPYDTYVHDTMADYTKLNQATGWEPKVSFEEGVRRVCKPYKDN